jgi:hypothetical protein
VWATERNGAGFGFVRFAVSAKPLPDTGKAHPRPKASLSATFIASEWLKR